MDLGTERTLAARSVAAYEGWTLGELRLGCDLEICAAPETRALLLRVTRLRPGAPLRPAAVGQAWLRLMKTGYFRAVTPVPKPTGPERLDLVFECEGVVVITNLEIGYDSVASQLYPQLFVSELRKRLRLRRGGRFPPLRADGTFSPEDAARLDKQKADIISLYEQQGYAGTRVEILPTFYGPGARAVRVKVRVHEGRQPGMGPVMLRGNTHLSYSEAMGPITTGERADFWKELFRAFGVGTFERRRLKEEVAKLEARYRQGGWFSARARLVEPVPIHDRIAYPRVEIFEGPHVEVAFEGNEALSEDALRRALTFTASGAVDQTEVQASALAIQSAYQAVAHYYATVEAQVQILDAEHQRILFVVHEGPRVYVRRVDLVGAQHIGPEELRAVMETKGIADDGVINSFGASAGVLQDTKVINDLTAVRRLYAERGFPGLRFRCAPLKADPARWNAAREAGEGGLDVWTTEVGLHRCFVVQRDADPRLVVLRVELREGLQTTVDRLAIDPLLSAMTPDMRDETDVLLQRLGFKDELFNWQRTGLNRSKLEQVRGFLLGYFRRQGYNAATAPAICGERRRLGEGPEDPCDQDQLYGMHLKSVFFDTRTGPLFRVDGILLRGNLRTHDAIILNELRVADGHPLGSEQLFLSQANLRSLGIFDSVSVETIGLELGAAAGAGTQDVTVVVTVEESTHQLLDAYAGLQLDSTPLTEEAPVLYRAGLSLRDRNLAGRALELGLGGNHANRVNTPQDVAGDDAVWEFGPFFKDRRLLGTRLDLSMEATYKRGQTGERDAYEEVINTKATVGYDFFNLSFPATWGRGIRATVRTEYRRDQRRGLTRRGERPPFSSPANTVGIQPAFTLDRRDNPLHPTRGYSVTVASEVLFQQNGAVPELSAPSFKETIVGQYVHSFFDRRLILSPSLRLGAVQTSTPETDLTSGFLFRAGGDAVTLPVRGYADAAIEACRGRVTGSFCTEAKVFGENDVDHLDPLTVGGLAMGVVSLEARFPTFLVDDFWWGLFGDMGAVAPSWSAMDSARLLPSLGVGLRWLVTGQIPLRLDLAFPLRDTAFARTSPRFHLNIFYSL